MNREMSLWDKFTKCDSGETINPLMHLFIFQLAALSVGLLFFDHTETVQALVLYQQTQVAVGTGFISLWGAVGGSVLVLHTLAAILRNRWSLHMMRLVIFGGGYVWCYAAIIYATSGFWMQFFAAAVPNLAFWFWYTINWRKRRRGDRVAFV